MSTPDAVPRRGHPPRPVGHGGGNESHPNPLRPLAFVAGGGRSVLRHHRCRGWAGGAGSRHSRASRRDGLHDPRVAEDRARQQHAARRCADLQCRRARREPPQRREGGAADFRVEAGWSPSRSAWRIGPMSAAPGPAAIMPPRSTRFRRRSASRLCRSPARPASTSAVLQFILANVRDPVACEGDLLAQIAATATAERRIHELCARHGTTTCSWPPCAACTICRRRRCGTRCAPCRTVSMRARISWTMAARRRPGAHPRPHHHRRGRGGVRPVRQQRPGQQFLQHHAVHRPLRHRLRGAHHERAGHAAE